jgi:hypothetical protein
MGKTKKMTIKYWNSLEVGSKRRALQFCYPTLPATVDMLLNEKPKKDNHWWKMVFAKVRIPEPDVNGCRHYKTVVNNTYIP